ncbi:oxidoreductase [Staphylococcus aureus]
MDADGNSFISGADFAVAVLDEIENPKHSRDHFAVGY